MANPVPTTYRSMGAQSRDSNFPISYAKNINPVGRSDWIDGWKFRDEVLKEAAKYAPVIPKDPPSAKNEDTKL